MSLLPRGFEPQVPEDLGQRSLVELREMLKRQERLLRNEKFICKLPDKGKKVFDSVAKLKAAIAGREEVRGVSELFHPVSLDSTLKQKANADIDVDIDKTQNPDEILDTSSLVPGSSSVDTIKSSPTASPKHGLVPPHAGDEERQEAEPPVNRCPAASPRARVLSSSEAREHSSPQSASSQVEDASSSLDSLFLDKLQRITISDQGEHPSKANTRTENLTAFSSRTQRKPHYMEVLEMRAKNPVPTAQKFKTNVLPSRQSELPGHQHRGVSPLASEERLRRDKQHLDDITAARLLPLHHMPTQLLSMEESLTLQKQQKQNYEEMQAKLAAQKLAEKLNIKMQSYNPEGESSRQYREVRDEDDDQSSDDEC
ncbi:protein GRINL1A isoform X1 [Ochotona curzoniae]|uniref:protein GRINL1A isoform X1 n=1 Tax=Ochotona curzoniae TaxID=130825 RepID=UPI001B3538AE|nr:protein GRINL1A isoform X1 [Ochotona curzoniae]